MQNVKVEVKVSLPSGSAVSLTENQTTAVSSFVTNMLFEAPERVKRTYRKKTSYSRWTPEEDALLLPLLTLKAREKKAYYKQVRKQTNRAQASIYSRVHALRKQLHASQSRPLINPQVTHRIPVTSFLG